MEETGDQYEILNFHLKNGCNIIAELIFADEHTIIINTPIEIKKRPSFTKDGVFEVITTSPFLLMTDTFQCTLPTSEILCKNWLHDNLTEMYKKMVSKYYMDIENIVESKTTEHNGTLH